MTSFVYTCYLSLGSNFGNELGTPAYHVVNAIDTITSHSNIENVTASSLYVSKPYGVTDQPDFVNAVLECQTNLTPQQLLDLCQTLEQHAKRQRLRHWGERSLDVDILLYGTQQINSQRLTVPHIEIEKRNFVLVPLAEIAPHLNILGKALKDMPLSRDWTGLVLMQS